MRLFKLLWQVHKWAGLSTALFFILIATTGLLLLVKKDFAALQPPTQRGTGGPPTALLTVPELYASVFAEGHPALASEADIDRIDFRPGKRCFKVRAKTGDWEIQVDATTGEVLSVAQRRSDFIERLHDGQAMGNWFHGWVAPVLAVTLVGLAVSGVYIWWAPIGRRRKRRREREVAGKGQRPAGAPNGREEKGEKREEK